MHEENCRKNSLKNLCEVLYSPCIQICKSYIHVYLELLNAIMAMLPLCVKDYVDSVPGHTISKTYKHHFNSIHKLPCLT